MTCYQGRRKRGFKLIRKRIPVSLFGKINLLVIGASDLEAGTRYWELDGMFSPKLK